MIIAIDGPAGAGKSTIAKLLAKKLDCVYIDTGAMYRAVTWEALQENADFNSSNLITQIARKIRIRLKCDKKKDFLRVFVENKEITQAIRSETVNHYVSIVASVPGVRKVMVQKQREMSKKENVVMEGRDIGTVVFPNADFKFYLDASPLERAKRRYKEFVKEGEKVNLHEIAKTIERRDRLDSTRKNSPLKKAKDAVIVDSTGLKVTEVIKKMTEVIRERV